MDYSPIPDIPDDPPEPVSQEVVSSYLPQYALAFGDMRKQTIEMHNYRLQMGEELQMRRELYLKELETSNQQKRAMLSNAIDRGDVSFGAALVQQNIPEIPEGIVTERLAAENGIAINNSDSPEFPRDARDAKITSMALALNNELGKVLPELPSFAADGDSQKIVKNAKTIGLWSAYILELLIPLRYSIGMAEDAGDALLPGSRTEELSTEFWKKAFAAKTPEEELQIVQDVIKDAREKFGSNPVMMISYIMESITTAQSENADALSVFGKKDLVVNGEKIKSILPELWNPQDSTLDYLMSDDMFLNGMNLLDVVGIGATAKALPRIAMRLMGQRAAAQIAAKASENAKVANNGSPALRASLSVVPSTLDIIPEVQSEIDNIRNLGMTALNDRVISQRVLPNGKVAEKILDKAQGEYGKRLINSKFSSTETGDTVLDVFVGNQKGRGYASLEAAEKANAKANNVYQVINGDELGLPGFYLKASRSVDEDGWLKGTQAAELESNKKLNAGWLSKKFRGSLGSSTDFGRYIWSPAVTAIYRSTREATSAALEKAKMGAVVERMLTPLEKLSSSKQDNLREIIQLGKLRPSRLEEGATGRWFDYGELDRAYRTKFGRGVSNEEATAYYAYKEVSDLAWQLGNETERSKMLAVGAESWRIKNHPFQDVIGRKVDSSRMAEDFTLLTPDGSVIFRKDISPDELKKYEVIEAYGQAEYNGNRFTHLLVEKNSAFTGGLQRNVFGYTEGGTRNYADVWFAKQKAVMSLGGKDIARNPLTHGVFKTKKKAMQYVNDTNEIVRIYNDHAKDLLKVQKGTLKKSALEVIGNAERLIQEINPDMSISKIEELVDAGQLDLKNPLEVVYDREMLTGFASDAPNWERLKNYQRNGKMYFSERGDHLLQDGEPAPLLDPYTALSNQIGSMIHANAYKNFAIREVGEWAASFGKNYEVPGLVLPSADELVKFGVWKGNNTPESNRLRNLAESQRMYVKRVLLQPGVVDEYISQAKSRLAQKLATSLGDSEKVPESVRTGKIVTETSAVRGLRTLAYDLALGFFNVGQIAVQGSAAITATILHPLHGASAIKDYGLIRAMAAADYNPAMVSVMDKRLAQSKFFGFKKGEFAKLIDDYRKSGIHLVGRSDATLDRLGAEGLAQGKIANAYDSVREALRMPVYEGERIGRIVSFGIARREAMDAVKAGRFAENSADYYQFIQKTTNKYTLNMMSGMETWWQRNQLAQLPMQFFQYPFKYMEVFLGMNKEFTQQERMRFILGHMFLYGMYGVPLGPEFGKGVLAPGYEEMTGQKMDEETYKQMMLGLMDDFATKMLGTDAAISTTFGSGNFIGEFIKDLYGDNTAIGLAGGVSLASMAKVWDAGTDIAKIWTTVAFNEGMLTSGPELISEATDITMAELGSIVRSMNNANKAYYLRKYGILLDNKGGVIERDSRYNIFLTAMGIRSSTEFQFWDVIESEENRTERLNDLKNKVTKLFVEANLAYHRDNDITIMQRKYDAAFALMADMDHADVIEVLDATRFRQISSFEEKINNSMQKGTANFQQVEE